jgi:hypothetical protein
VLRIEQKARGQGGVTYAQTAHASMTGITMLEWLKRTLASEKPKMPQTVDEAMSAYRDLLVKYPIAIMDVSMLPIPKKQMKLLLKALYAKVPTAELKSYIETGFTLLSNFQEGVGPTPIDGGAPFNGKLPTQAEIANLEKWLAWEKVSMAEAEALTAEWKQFLAGEPI